MTQLSKRAIKLYERVKSGKFYMAYSDNLPKAMKELEDAGLVTITGRPMVFVAAYVPTTGFTPYVDERFETEEDNVSH